MGVTFGGGVLDRRQRDRLVSTQLGARSKRLSIFRIMANSFVCLFGGISHIHRVPTIGFFNKGRLRSVDGVHLLVGGTGIVVLCTSPNDLAIGHNVRANTAFKGLKLAQFLGQPDVFLFSILTN